MFDPANKPDKERLENILYIIMQIASGNVDARAVISEGADDIDAISLGINMLGEEIKAMQEKLKAEINETKNAKEELENFSYAVSHNLRGPLRAIDGYSHILMSDYFEILNKTGQKNLDIIIRNTEKMEYLIDGLLAFTGYGKQTLNKVTINLNLLVKKIIKQLKSEIKEAGKKKQQTSAQIIIFSMPAVKADKAMIEEVWKQLISNALKFSSGRTTPKIEIGADKQDGYIHYYVKDNGIGFDMKYYNKLFGVFQSLHSSIETGQPGVSVGLALAHRIISRHGGRLWAEGKVNKGAIFYFSLPDT